MGEIIVLCKKIEIVSETITYASDNEERIPKFRFRKSHSEKDEHTSDGLVMFHLALIFLWKVINEVLIIFQ